MSVRRTGLLSERTLAAIESLLTPEDAARRLGVDEATIRRAIADGKLPVIRIGGEGRQGRTLILGEQGPELLQMASSGLVGRVTSPRTKNRDTASDGEARPAPKSGDRSPDPPAPR